MLTDDKFVFPRKIELNSKWHQRGKGSVCTDGNTFTLLHKFHDHQANFSNSTQLGLWVCDAKYLRRKRFIRKLSFKSKHILMLVAFVVGTWGWRWGSLYLHKQTQKLFQTHFNKIDIKTDKICWNVARFALSLWPIFISLFHKIIFRECLFAMTDKTTDKGWRGQQACLINLFLDVIE